MIIGCGADELENIDARTVRSTALSSCVAWLTTVGISCLNILRLIVEMTHQAKRNYNEIDGKVLKVCWHAFSMQKQ